MNWYGKSEILTKKYHLNAKKTHYKHTIKAVSSRVLSVRISMSCVLILKCKKTRCPGHVHDVSLTCPGRVRGRVFLNNFSTRTPRTCETKVVLIAMILTMRTCIQMFTPGIMRRRHVGSNINARTSRRCEDGRMNVGCAVFPNPVVKCR